MTFSPQPPLDVSKLAATHFPAIQQLMTQTFQNRARGLVREMVTYQMMSGGKHLRAMIPVLFYQAINQDPSAIYPFCAALEVAHNATLVHDDIQDQDLFRRGRPTIWNRYTEAQAINCGDALFFYAIDLLLKLTVPPKLKEGLLTYFVETMLTLVHGQTREFELKDMETPAIQDYIEAVKEKTAALFKLTLLGSAMLAQLDEDSCLQISILAEKLGIIFQLQDDLIDILGGKEREQTGTDISEGKVSILITYLLPKISPPEKLRLQEILRKDRSQTTREEIDWVISIMKSYQAIEFAKELIAQYKKEILSADFLSSAPHFFNLFESLIALFLQKIS